MCLLTFGRGAQRRDSHDARVESLQYSLDHATLARGIPAFEHNNDPLAGLANRLLQLHHLLLETAQLGFVEPLLQFRLLPGLLGLDLEHFG